MQPSRRDLLAAVTLCLTALVVPAAAHHGWGGYDATQVLNLSGTVRQSAYENPHGELLLEVAGKVWRVTLSPPSRMQNRGLSPEMLKPGTLATVVGYPSKTDPEEMRAERITIGTQTTELR